ncbi:hypothetical protein [Planktothricoides raciborskii]|uniref:Uncharacterized protein n=2 Tax=Planktothricoides raciborskii TaxID=132608 RepID=A0AAU8JND9_9CYAN|nr:hypothetical protein [Planktothricoides raciborskii]MBD2543516.1 hypothetical protein [Planktothricoides raciborskii FACHB-1370]MBD2581206.1 hypothetical protein [Planktothricoides raciborskii FACHB-1261]
MQSIRVRFAQAIRFAESRIGKNGIVQIQLPEVTEGTEVDIIVVYESTSTAKDTKKMSDRFYGCIQDETFLRHPQPEPAERETF